MTRVLYIIMHYTFSVVRHQYKLCLFEKSNSLEHAYINIACTVDKCMLSKKYLNKLLILSVFNISK